MHFSSQSTPESLLPRSDSKNPASTCKGITSNGRPCRRSLAQSSRVSPATSPGRGPGVLAVVQNLDGQSAGAAAFFCWQHKDQANVLLQGTADGNTEIVNLQTRTSTDSLVARLGVVTIEEEEGEQGVVHKQKRQRRGSSRPVCRGTLPPTWQNVSGPLIAVDSNGMPSQARQVNDRASRHRRRGDLHISFFCCMSAADVDHDPPIAPKPVTAAKKPSNAPRQAPKSAQLPIQPITPQKKTSIVSSSPSATPTSPLVSNSAQSAYTQALLSFIPSSTSPGTTKLLLMELSKPLTPSDQESGYIYIFWMTPSSVPQPAASDASTLLAPPARSLQDHRASDIIRTYSVKASSGSAQRDTRYLMLKIGRASNVTRRMTEWSRQCGYHITLLRYYPYHSHAGGSPFPSPTRRVDNDHSATSTTVQQVPLVSRVERLIHVSLNEQRVMRACDGCGKTHREWFEVEATKEGIRRIDATVKRWVEWGLEEGKGS